jgi:hypothetical protein
MRFALVPLLAVAALCTGCGGGGQPAPAPSPTLLVQGRGAPTSLQDAVRKANFPPFIPSAQIVGVAALPPLSDDEKKRRFIGIGIEYESNGDALLLSQWPRAGFNIAVGTDDITSRPCAPVAYKPDGLLWTTRNGRVMTLQPDGTVLPARIAREADRLLRAGACGQEPRASTSRRTPRPPAVFSHRQSAS